MPDPDSREMIQAANRLAEEFRRTREDLTARLEKAERDERENRTRLEAAEEREREKAEEEQKKERKGRRAVHRLIGAIAVLALAFALWTHHQDDVRAANHQAGLARDIRLEQQQAASLKKIALLQQQIVLFQQRACVEAADWGEYLDENPGITPKSRAAAHRIAAAAAGLCSRTPAPKP